MDDLTNDPRVIETAGAISSAETLLIGAGAGLSAAAGYDFTSEEKFARDYPAMLQYGLSQKIQMMANFSVGENLLWGYYLQNVAETRFDNQRSHPGYKELKQLSEFVNDWFVITTNVDALFERNGFNVEQIYTPQGDYGVGQCRAPCTNTTWSSKPWIDTLLPQVNRTTQMLDDALLPRCPNCGGKVFFNVRCAHWFVDAPWEPGRLAWQKWQQKTVRSRVVAIDIGSGFNTPMWVRWPLEEITTRNPANRLIRLNRDQPEVPKQINKQSIQFRESPEAVLRAIIRRLPRNLSNHK